MRGIRLFIDAFSPALISQPTVGGIFGTRTLRDVRIDAGRPFGHDGIAFLVEFRFSFLIQLRNFALAANLIIVAAYCTSAAMTRI